MAQLTIRTHDDQAFKINRDDRADEGIKLPPDGFVTFKGNDGTELTIHVKTIHSIHLTKQTGGTRP